MLNWKEWFCWHDWEYLYQQYSLYIEWEYFGLKYYSDDGHNVYMRVCTKCGKVEDTFHPFRRECENKIKVKKNREEFAKKRYEEWVKENKI